MRFLFCTILAIGYLASTAVARDQVQIISPQKLDGPASYGIAKLIAAISDRGVTVELGKNMEKVGSSDVIVAGFATQPRIADLITAAGLALPKHPESLAVRRIHDTGRSTIVLCGSDAIGLMYAALDTAQRIGWAAPEGDLFAHVRNTSESPCLTDRSVSTYTMHRRLFEQRLYDDSYWQRYFDMLAASRINSYVIIFGYENGGFMAPIYPYFFDVEGFPDVELYGSTVEQQAKNTAALRRVIELAHERGIRITAGIWDHIYRGGVQGGGIAGASDLVGKRTPHLVYGVTKENLAQYTKAALAKFLTEFPNIDGIQFRMHWESGLTRNETSGFWREVFSTLRRRQPNIRFDLRAKGLPDEVIDEAVAQRLPFRITTKYWMEQLGMPFHPTHINPQNQRDRRHGYADLLRYPKRYDVHWRMWSGGTARFLLWGDPEFVRRCVRSARVYDGRSIEVNEMLATKMLGSPHDQEPFELLTPAYRHYDYEFERYWHYYQVWGRVTYNPNVSSELWECEFASRFGTQAGPQIMEALHAASKVLPRIVAASYNYRYFPTTRGWAEMMRMGDLPEYAQGTGTDVEQFQSYQEAASQLLAGKFTAKRTPFQTSAWFAGVADRILAGVAATSATAGDLEGEAAREFQATTTDLKILAYLARYHAARMKAAVWYNVYLKTKDRLALEQTLAHESQAIRHWSQVIKSAGDVYPETLKFGVHRVGFSWHWKEEIDKLNEGLQQLRRMPSENILDANLRQRLLRQATRFSDVPAISLRVERAALAIPAQDLTVTANVETESPLESVRLRYRHLTQFENYETCEMTFDPTTGKYTGIVPGSFIVPEWDLVYFIEVFPKNDNGRIMPDLEQEMPYVIVPVERVVAD